MVQMDEYYDSIKRRVAYLGSYPPRECGIATFTKDLIDNIDKMKVFKPVVIAVNEKGAIYDYDRRVKFRIERDVVDDYVQAANYVNSSNIELVNLQHEFGLFGGENGEYINYFLDNVKKPVVTTLHTVQPNFSEKEREILKHIISCSKSIVIISNIAINLLKKQGLSCKKCATIPHGCPGIELEDSNPIKNAWGLKDRLIISTFGLISAGKGIEYVIRALPSVVKNEPRIIYLIIGETHPEVRKRDGEKYRNKLIKLVDELGLEKNVRFHNRFLLKTELIKFLQATDIYITPYISPNQISSGTLTYALGAGKPVISTPYFHAQETLANGRGLFCKFKDPYSISQKINELLDLNLRKQIQKRVYKYSRRFLWSTVAKSYVNLFEQVIKAEEKI